MGANAVTQWVALRRWLARSLYMLAAWIDVPRPVVEFVPEPEQVAAMATAINEYAARQVYGTPELVVESPLKTMIQSWPGPIYQPEAIAQIPTMTEAKVYCWDKGNISEAVAVIE